MATPILKVETQYCSAYVDDIRLSELMTTNPPLYARKMWGYFLPAISLFTLPAEMPEYLVGTAQNPKLTEPSFTDYTYAVENDIDENTTISLGDDYKGFELFSANIVQTAANGRIIQTPATNIIYDAESGSITINASSDAPVAAGTVYYLDFYTDGEFQNTLTPQMMNILGMCFQVVWKDRFNTDWLSDVSKIEDKSFFEQNRANKERADTERHEHLMKKLAGEMRRFEQNIYYKQYVTKKLNI